MQACAKVDAHRLRGLVRTVASHSWQNRGKDHERQGERNKHRHDASHSGVQAPEQVKQPSEEERHRDLQQDGQEGNSERDLPAHEALVT